VAEPRVMGKAVVAVVDDDRRMLEALQDLLESAGHDVRAFPSASAFLTSACFDNVDCVICDVCMPGMDGWGVQRQAALRRPTLPIILITAHANEARFTSARCIGTAPEIFRKPFDSRLLLQAVESRLRGG
jgi:FixJ family two-component response regulator